MSPFVFYYPRVISISDGRAILSGGHGCNAACFNSQCMKTPFDWLMCQGTLYKFLSCFVLKIIFVYTYIVEFPLLLKFYPILITLDLDVPVTSYRFPRKMQQQLQESPCQHLQNENVINAITQIPTIIL